MKSETGVAEVSLSPNGDNVQGWLEYLYSCTGEIGKAHLVHGAIQLIMTPDQFLAEFSVPPTVILTPSLNPVGNVNYRSQPPAASAFNREAVKEWHYLDNKHKEYVVIVEKVRTIVLTSLSNDHQKTIHGGAKTGTMKFTVLQMVEKMCSLYEKVTVSRVNFLQEAIDRPYRTSDQNLHAHVANQAQAVQDMADLRGEVTPDSVKYASLRKTIQHPLLWEDLIKKYDYTYSNILLRTYQSLTEHLKEHADGVMAIGGDTYPASLSAHAVVGGSHAVAAMAASAGDPELQAVIAAFQASKQSPTPAAASATNRHSQRQQQQQPAPSVVPHPKAYDTDIYTYCHKHGYQAIAEHGHSSAECKFMQRGDFTAKQRKAAAHVRNADGTAYGDFRGFSKL